MITVTAADAAEYQTELHSDESSIAIQAGETLTERQMLEAMLTQSANDIAFSLAMWDAGSMPAFVAKMNALVASLGATDTHYVDASGYDPQSVSSASDVLPDGGGRHGHPGVRADGGPDLGHPPAGRHPPQHRLRGRRRTASSASSRGTRRAPAPAWCWPPNRTVQGRQVLVLVAVLGQPTPPPDSAETDAHDDPDDHDHDHDHDDGAGRADRPGSAADHDHDHDHDDDDDRRPRRAPPRRRRSRSTTCRSPTRSSTPGPPPTPSWRPRWRRSPRWRGHAVRRGRRIRSPPPGAASPIGAGGDRHRTSGWPGWPGQRWTLDDRFTSVPPGSPAGHPGGHVGCSPSAPSSRPSRSDWPRPCPSRRCGGGWSTPRYPIGWCDQNRGPWSSV